MNISVNVKITFPLGEHHVKFFKEKMEELKKEGYKVEDIEE